MAHNCARLCGAGITTNSLYNQLGLSYTGGIDVNSLVYCPALAVDIKSIGLTAQGVKILPRVMPDGSIYEAHGRQVWDIWDIIGEKHYQYPIDFYQEVRHKGFSRKIPKTANLSMLSPYSVHFVLHKYAVMKWDANNTNERDLWLGVQEKACLRDIEKHDHPSDPWIYGPEVESCCKLWWAHPTKNESHYFPSRNTYNRPGIGYVFEVLPREDDCDISTTYGRFMWFPIGHMVVTANTDGEFTPEAEEVIEALRKAGLADTIEKVDINDLPEED